MFRGFGINGGRSGLFDEVLDGERAVVETEEFFVIIVDGGAGAVDEVMEQPLADFAAAVGGGQAIKDASVGNVVIEIAVNYAVRGDGAGDGAVEKIILLYLEAHGGHDADQLTVRIHENQNLHGNVVAADAEMDEEFFLLFFVRPAPFVEGVAKGRVYLICEYVTHCLSLLCR